MRPNPFYLGALCVVLLGAIAALARPTAPATSKTSSSARLAITVSRSAAPARRADHGRPPAWRQERARLEAQAMKAANAARAQAQAEAARARARLASQARKRIADGQREAAAAWRVAQARMGDARRALTNLGAQIGARRRQADRTITSIGHIGARLQSDARSFMKGVGALSWSH